MLDAATFLVPVTLHKNVLHMARQGDDAKLPLNIAAHIAQVKSTCRRASYLAKHSSGMRVRGEVLIHGLVVTDVFKLVGLVSCPVATKDDLDDSRY